MRDLIKEAMLNLKKGDGFIYVTGATENKIDLQPRQLQKV